MPLLERFVCNSCRDMLEDTIEAGELAAPCYLQAIGGTDQPPEYCPVTGHLCEWEINNTEE